MQALDYTGDPPALLSLALFVDLLATRKTLAQEAVVTQLLLSGFWTTVSNFPLAQFVPLPR